MAEHSLCSGDRVEVGPLVFEVQFDPTPSDSDPSGDTLCRSPTWADTIALTEPSTEPLPDTPARPDEVRGAAP